MPELPEVEVTRITLAPMLEGARIGSVHLGKPLRWPLGVKAEHLVGRVFGPLMRRGKYLWMPLAPDGGLLVHLGMSGSLTFEAAAGPDVGAAGVWPSHVAAPPAAPAPAHTPAPPGPHDHVVIATDRGVLRLTDPRRFGAVVWSSSLQAPPAATLLAGLGREPDDPQLTAAWFHDQLHRRRAPIKQVLLAGDVVVGAGNIYACEALFDAGIDPRTRAQSLSRPRTARLLAAVQATLARALALGGSTLRDFRDAHGMSGAFQREARVYGREGQPCTACGTPIRRVVMGQRSTYFCPRCQRR